MFTFPAGLRSVIGSMSSAIFHGVEGKGFHAWSVREGVARPLIAGAKAEAHVR